MASCITSQWVATAPQAKLTVTKQSETATTVTLAYTAQYIASYAASTNGAGRAFTITINGSTVKTGSYNIHGVTGTKTITSGTVTVSKGTSAKDISFSISFTFSLTWSGEYKSTMSASGSIGIGAKTSYAVKYSANGGSGAPSSQTKWHGTTLTLSSTKPTRTGYTFQGWATSSSGSVSYAAGASYTKNAAVTLYAIWKINTYTVKYSANGGSGAPSSQTKTYGKTLTLSSTKPTRTGYTFKGWATSSSGSVAYAAGASYTANAAVTLYAVWEIKTYTVKYNANGGSGAPSSQTKTHGTTLTLSSTKPTRSGYTFKGWGTSASSTTVAYAAGASYTTNAATTLYAVWQSAYSKPKISGLSVSRCNSSGTITDEGTNALVKFNWSCSNTVTAVKISWKSSATSAQTTTVTASGTSGSVSKVVGSNAISIDYSYTITVSVTDSGGTTSVVKTLPSMKLPIDFLAGGTGVAMGKVAELSGYADFGYKTRHRDRMVFDNQVCVYGLDPSGTVKQIINAQNDTGNLILGWGGYDAGSGNTHIYGHDINIGFSNTASGVSLGNGKFYRPYFRKGDSFEINVKTSGFLTSSGYEVHFTIPIARPVVGSPTISVADVSGFVLRQEGNYTHGTSASSRVTATELEAFYNHCGVHIRATFATRENYLNNAPIGVQWNGTITFS